ncbi:MAG: tetratricopeptide repeat protein [Saprospiraceae bacterium]
MEVIHQPSKFLKSLIPILGVLVLFLACGPKTVEKAKKTEETPERVKSTLEDNVKSNPKYPTFFSAAKGEQAKNAHVIYRDFVRSKKYDEAFEYWKEAYTIAPAADGRRNYHFVDGIKIYDHFYTQATDKAKKDEHMAVIMRLYDELADCYGEKGYVYGKKAFDLYYKYPDYGTEEETYELFKKSIKEDGIKSNYFILNPFTAMMVDRFLAEKIPMAEAQDYTKQIKDIIAEGLKTCEGKQCDPWKVVESYAPVRLESLEGVKDFYDCDYYSSKYYGEHEAEPTNCDVTEMVYGRLRWGGCPETDPKMINLKALVAKCNPVEVVDPKEKSAARLGYEALRDGNYSEAVKKYTLAAEEANDAEKKSMYYLRVAKIYYAYLKRFSQARTFAQKAADARPNWGEPYLVIGNLYASSGALCGPGTGFDSQVVTWPAIDMWQKAKSVDPSVASDANRLINKYAKYMPTKGDIFLRGLKVGGSYKVGCWIQRSTKIRTAD